MQVLKKVDWTGIKIVSGVEDFVIEPSEQIL